MKKLSDMTTTLEKNKPARTSKDKETVKNKKRIVHKLLPGESEIREKANELYLQRVEHGEHGNAENDWIEAEKYLKDFED